MRSWILKHFERRKVVYRQKRKVRQAIGMKGACGRQDENTFIEHDHAGWLACLEKVTLEKQLVPHGGRGKIQDLVLRTRLRLRANYLVLRQPNIMVQVKLS